MTEVQSAVDRVLGPLEGGAVPGGCDSCDAVQVPIKIDPAVWVIEVQHDDWRPVLVSYENRREVGGSENGGTF